MLDSPQLEETIPKSEESSEKESENWKEKAQEKQFNDLEKLEMAERMVGLDILRTGTELEGIQSRAWMQDNHELIYGENSKGAKLDLQSEEDKMAGIQLGNNTTTHNYTSPIPKKTSGFLKSAALVAAGIMVGGLPLALPPVINYLSKDNDPITEVIEKTIEGTSEGLRVLQPKVIKPNDG